jgi:hypothetical protein
MVFSRSLKWTLYKLGEIIQILEVLKKGMDFVKISTYKFTSKSSLQIAEVF